MPTPAAIATKARGLTPGSIVELMLLDASDLVSEFSGLAGEVYAFHNYNDYGTSPLTFQTIQYFPYPLQMSGFESNSGADKQARPQLSLSNVGSFMSSILAEFSDLIGAKLTRKCTLYDYLDGQPAADPTQEMPQQIFYVTRKLAETKSIVSLELGTSIDVEGIKLPRRQLTPYCPWRYRGGDGCPYVGDAVTDEFDNNFGVTNPRGAWDPLAAYAVGDSVFIVLNDIPQYYVCVAPSAAGLYPRFNPELWKRDTCVKTPPACQKRFGVTAVLPFGGFPAIVRSPVAS